MISDWRSNPVLGHQEGVKEYCGRLNFSSTLKKVGEGRCLDGFKAGAEIVVRRVCK
jgi:hypothetical protein